MTDKLFKFISIPIIIILSLVIIFLVTNNKKEQDNKYESWLNQEEMFTTTTADVGSVEKTLNCETNVEIDETKYKKYIINKDNNNLNVCLNQIINKNDFLDVNKSIISDVFGRVVNIGETNDIYEIVISDFTKLKSQIFIEQKYSNYIKIGSSVDIMIDDKMISGTIINHSYRIIDGYLLVDVEYESDSIVYEGSNASVNLLIDERENVLCVAKDALMGEKGGYYLNELIDGKVHKAIVQVGLIGDNYVQIYSGIKKGTVVIINNAD